MLKIGTFFVLNFGISEFTDSLFSTFSISNLFDKTRVTFSETSSGPSYNLKNSLEAYLKKGKEKFSKVKKMTVKNDCFFSFCLLRTS